MWDVLLRGYLNGMSQPHPEFVADAFRELERGLTPEQMELARRLPDMEWTDSEREQIWKASREKRLLEEIERNRQIKLKIEARQKLEAEQRKQRAEQDFLASAKEGLKNNDVALSAFIDFTAEHVRLFAKQLTLARAVREFGMSKETRARLEAELVSYKAAKALDRQESARATRELQEWRRALVPSFSMPETLGATKTEYQRWLKEGRLEPSTYRSVRKWGKSIEYPLFDGRELALITPEVLAQWRAEDEAKHTHNRRAGAAKGAAKAKTTRTVKQALRLHAYEDSFEAARQMQRSVHLCLGPTNSGKTYRAIEALAAAESGTYLAPLRLLALEVYEKLKDRGIKVSLVTGEERILDPNAKHVCSTIEMCDFGRVTQVAVIDEVQMLGDSQRGWAWTAALLGVPAAQVYLCGATHARDAVISLLDHLEQSYEEFSFERKTPLIMQIDKKYPRAEPGDARISFSRKAVLEDAANLKKAGFRVSTLYGALSPEVRRAQARAFQEGVSDILVATDAIGMGLNLPIRRVVFTEVQKFDGTQVRRLTAAEIQQIAGRAGRFGCHDEGLVTAFGREEQDYVRSMLASTIPTLQGPFFIMPTWAHVERVMKVARIKSVVSALGFFERISFGTMFTRPDLTPLKEKAEFARCLGLAPETSFRLACAPADLDHGVDLAVLRRAAQSLAQGVPMGIAEVELSVEHIDEEGEDLEDAERWARELSLCAWLGSQFPGLVDMERLPRLRLEVAEYINKGLDKHRGGRKTYPRQRLPNWLEDDDL